ncbi:hypothetical protein A5658_07105 [Mycobacterium sp. 1245111.1]|uniref:DUF4190 domain-containing protein n=1 Tax=Mycobacterium sp. 1245111.1 TaxID=1834073 RepID=UPI0008020C02|nr:DUF4190 domain-containing protein [Mycobacterium sp. 1245111.1]OBK35930.1 hypothetical protein A5658_07105 [Mycobacterium sp. 1245111.1]
MTAPGGGEPYRDQPGPWQPYQHPPVDPQAPVNYPEYPYPSPYGSYPAPPPYPGPPGYPSPPPYPGAYDPYLGYQTQQTNGLAVASLVTSIAGVVFGIPLAIFCYIGWLIPVVGAVLGGIALGQIKQRGQQGRGMAIAGIAIGSATAALLVLFMVVAAAAAFHAPMFGVV